MTRRAALSAVTALALLSCRARHEPPAPLPAVAPRCAPFHVALVESETSGPGSFLPVHGRTLLEVEGARLAATPAGLIPIEATDPAFEINPAGWLYGTWPGAIWRVERHDQGGGKPNRVADRWTGKGWEPFTQWIGGSGKIEPWGDGLLLDHVEVTGYATESGGPPLGYGLRILHADGKQEEVPETLASNLHPPLDFAVVGRTIFVAASFWHAEGELRVSVNKEAPLPSTTFATHTADVRLWAASERDAVAFGGTAAKETVPLFVHWDGERWNPEPAPPGVDKLVAFDRSTDGADRVFAKQGERLSLWERPRGAAWHRIALPEQFPDESITNEWLLNGEAWIHVSRDGKPGLVLRLGPATRVYHVGKGLEDPDPADACLPVEKDDAVDAAR